MSTGEVAAWFKPVRRRLFSYYYHGFNNGNKPSPHVLHAAETGRELFLDSGAFTAFSKGAEIAIDQYAAFIHDTHNLWTVRSSLDAIGNAAKSYDYLKQLEALGCKVQPVFHAREDVSWLVKYLDAGYDYIFIGGMVPETTQWLTGWLDDLFNNYLTNADGAPRVKLHGFGLTDQKLMFRYPWHSVDSTSWLMTGIFGACVFTTPHGLRKVVFSKDSPQTKELNSWHYYSLPKIAQREVDKWLEEFGVTAQQCSEHYTFRDAVNAATFQRMEALGVRVFKKQEAGLFG